VTDRDAGELRPDGEATAPPLSEHEFNEIYGKVPRLTVEVIVRSPNGILLTKRWDGPCAGLWHIPGGTVRFAEPLTAAVTRVASAELGMEIAAGPLLGYIEYPSHYLNGLDAPVGIAFLCEVDGEVDPTAHAVPGRGWFTEPPDPMHAEQIDFLTEHGLLVAQR
jgi:ADP-ribose pyrophosphatase YjhB (NUDIX family)